MKSLIPRLLLALAALSPMQVLAQDASDAEVRKVDKAASKLTLKHGEIRNLDMPPMTMVFAVRDKAVLDTLKPGDKVKFKATKDGGTYTVTEIQVQN